MLLWLMWWGVLPARSAVLMELDIPAQELAPALEAFSRSTAMAVLVDRELTRGRRSVAVKGRFAATDALRVLLTGSGLMARYTRADAFTLQMAQVEDRPLPHGPTTRSTELADSSYAAAIQQTIERTLCRSPLTRPGSFRALVQLWIGRDGTVQHSRLISSTGDVQRDGALVKSLQHLKVQRSVPSSLRQPVTLLLLPDSSGKRMECIQQEGTWGA